MFRSLRANLFMAFIGLMVLFLCGVLAINVFFLDDIFIYGTEKAMLNTAESISASMASGEFSEEHLTEASFKTGLYIGVFSEDGFLEYSSGLLRAKIDGGEPAPLKKPENRDMKKIDISRETNEVFLGFMNQTERTRMLYTEQGEGPRRSVILMERLENGKTLLMMKPLVPIRESSRLATVFTLVSGTIVMLVGAAGVFVMSGRITSPILAMDRVARKMAGLDFSETISVSNRDELGTLGSSIQTMSESLHQTLTELKEANSKLKDEIQREREIDRQRRRFISSVSHELRTPLSMIQGYADGLRHNVVEDPQGVQEYCEVIVDETRKMSGLIRDMLDLSSYEAGAFTHMPRDFDLAGLVNQTVSRFKALGEVCDVVAQGPDSCFTVGDEGRIGQVLVNFLNNGIRHSAEGAPIVVRYGVTDTETFIAVTNQGAPIAEDELVRIWEPFYKSDKSGYSNSGGVGLGLAIAGAIAAAHKGRCLAENSAEGVTFSIYWP